MPGGGRGIGFSTQSKAVNEVTSKRTLSATARCGLGWGKEGFDIAGFNL